MKAMKSMKLTLAIIMSCALVAGCSCSEPEAAMKIGAPQVGAYSSARSTVPSAPAPIPALLATVNGHPIAMSALHDALVADYGLALAHQIIADTVVAQELKKRSMATDVTPLELRTETLRALERIFGFGDKVPPAKQLEQLLGQFLKQQKLTRRQWDQVMNRNARLGRLIGKNIRFSDAQLRRAFIQFYGGTWQARHIQVPSRQKAEEVLRAIKAGGDFAMLAKMHSTNPTGKTGGVLLVPMKNPPKELPTHIIQAISALSPGEVSAPVLSGAAFHLLKLEKKLPPAGLKFEDKKNEIARALAQQEITRRQQTLLMSLVRAAEVKYIDPTVKAQHAQTQQPK